MSGSLVLIFIFLAGVILWLSRRKKSERPSSETPVAPPDAEKGGRRHFSGLQWRMTFSYVWITIASILLIFFVLSLVSVFLNAIPVDRSDASQNHLAIVQTVARQYAKAVAQQAQGQALPAVFPYPLGERLQNSSADNYTDAQARYLITTTNAVPYLSRLYPASQPVSFALLVAPDMRILSSSYPARYTPGKSASVLLPERAQSLQNAVRNRAPSGTLVLPEGIMLYATAPVLNKLDLSVGAIYVQVPLTTLLPDTSVLRLPTYVVSLLVLTGVLLLVLTPLGGIFGFISTRGMVRRLKTLASATTLVADGDYQQRLRVGSRDELGQLEQQFNRMAEQLGASAAREKTLAEENARLAERSRISRELHDAISQDLFSLSMLAGGLQSALPADSPLQHQASILEQTTTSMIREMRALLLELRPTSLETLSLSEALEELARAYSTRLDITVKTQIAPLHLETRLEHTLLCIAQEALSNTARHASASEISLILALEGQTVTLSLQDNGQGLQMDEENRRHGLGLRLMEERVQELHGTLNLSSIPDQGTTLEVHFPLNEETL